MGSGEVKAAEGSRWAGGAALSVPARPAAGPPGSRGSGRRVERGRPRGAELRGSPACKPGPPLAQPPSGRSVNEPPFPSVRRLGTSRRVQGSGKFSQGAVWAEVRTGAGPEPSGPSSQWPCGAIAQRFRTRGAPRAWPASPSALVGAGGASRDTSFRIRRGGGRDCALRGVRGCGRSRVSPATGA